MEGGAGRSVQGGGEGRTVGGGRGTLHSAAGPKERAAILLALKDALGPRPGVDLGAHLRLGGNSAISDAAVLELARHGSA